MAKFPVSGNLCYFFAGRRQTKNYKTRDLRPGNYNSRAVFPTGDTGEWEERDWMWKLESTAPVESVEGLGLLSEGSVVG